MKDSAAHNESPLLSALLTELYYLLLAFVFVPPPVSDSNYSVVLDFFVFPPLMALLTLAASLAFVDNAVPAHLLFGIILVLSYVFTVLLCALHTVVFRNENEFTDHLHALKFTLAFLAPSFLLIGAVPQVSAIVALICAMCQAIYACRVYINNLRARINILGCCVYSICCGAFCLFFVAVLGKVVYPSYFTGQHVIESLKMAA